MNKEAGTKMLISVIYSNKTFQTYKYPCISYLLLVSSQHIHDLIILLLTVLWVRSLGRAQKGWLVSPPHSVGWEGSTGSRGPTMALLTSLALPLGWLK